jgi:hypothetical protein
VRVQLDGFEEEVEKIVRSVLKEGSYRRELMSEAKRNLVNAANAGQMWSPADDEAFKNEFIFLVHEMGHRFGRSWNSITARYRLLRSKGWNPWKDC